MTVDIPVPVPGDPERVSISLRNAAIFGRVGDVEEALHWLQRAAEAAGETEDDSRTLLLARTASELSRVVRGIASELPAATNEAQRAKPLPKPPVPSSSPDAARAGEAAMDGEPTLVGRRRLRTSDVPLPQATPCCAADSEAQRAPTRPPPRSAPTSRPRLPNGSGSQSPSSVRPRNGSPPLKSSRPPTRNGSPPLKSSRPPPLDGSRPPPLDGSRPPPLDGSRPPPLDGSRPPTLDGSRPPTLRARPSSSPRTEPSPPSTAACAETRVRPRQAARVSVERSSFERGLFLVRILEEGSAPGAGRIEAMLVAIDPNECLISS